MSEDLKLICDGLSLEDKVEVREYLNTLITLSANGLIKSPERCSTLMGKVAEIQGKRDIGFKSRESSDVWARTLVAYQMINEGYTTTEIGAQMRKDHSTIIYLRRKMEGVFELPQAYRDIIQLWNEFQKQIQQ